MKTLRPRDSVSYGGPDPAIMTSVASRRDFYLGLWAGRQFGLSDTALHDYARSIVEADKIASEPETLIQKLEHDFAIRGCPVEREEIIHQLHRTQAVAHRQFISRGSTN